LAYLAPFPPLPDQAFPPARNHSRWQGARILIEVTQLRPNRRIDIYQSHDEWVSEHWPFPNDSKRSLLPATKLAGLMTWGELKLAPLSTNNQTEESAAAPFANYERLKWACRMTGIFILVDDLVNAHDRDPTLIAGFRSVVDGKGFMINAVLRYAADINLTDETLNHPLIRKAERIAAEYGSLANDLRAYSYEKTPPSDAEDILNILSNQYQLTHSQA
ncbi:hypothetical protein HWV62_6373, partial [Athelia sp. TMB]